MSEIIEKIRELATTSFTSEDDLLAKVVVPFFLLLGYQKDQYALKYPVSTYRPLQPGRKPEADCVFFKDTTRSIDTSMLVVEVKREEQLTAELQARFYASNLFVPFYVTWEALTFEIFQLHSFRSPTSIGKYNLSKLPAADFADIRNTLSPDAVIDYCEKNEIKPFDIKRENAEVEGRYVSNLSAHLKQYRVLDLPRTLDIEESYVPLYVQKFHTETLLFEDVESKVEAGKHPSEIENLVQQQRDSYYAADLIEATSHIAIIGDPGAGKTTLLRHICIQNCTSLSVRLPIFISVRELIATKESLKEAIASQIKAFSHTDNPDSIIEPALGSGRLLLCLDGLDELDIQDPGTARVALRNILSELKRLIVINSKNIVILSARRESWPTCRPEVLPSFQNYEILPLATKEIKSFIEKWFVNTDPQLAKILTDELRRRGWPTFTSNPLLLALTAIVYEKRLRLPERLSALYQRCMDVLLEEWDSTRRISRRGLVDELTPEKTLEILAEVAFAFHEKHRACFSKAEILSELHQHLPKVTIDSSKAEYVFEQIITQYGLLRSWSIETAYAFPHLAFQEYLVAKALRDRKEGFTILCDKKYDPFWHHTLKLYSEMGDSSDLIRRLDDQPVDIFKSSLFLAAEVLSANGKISDLQIRNKIVKQLAELATNRVEYLRNRSIEALALIGGDEAKSVLRNLLRDKSGKIDTHSYAARYAIKIEGYGVVREIVDTYLSGERVPLKILENFADIPLEEGLRILYRLITSEEYPDVEDKRIISHKRSDAALLLARLGGENAIPLLRAALGLKYLSDYVRAGIVRALASIHERDIKSILRDIMFSEYLPVDCRVEAARNLAPQDYAAKKFLLRLADDKEANFYDRRDAASSLKHFELQNDDITFLTHLLNDTNAEFWGGPTCAAEAIAKVKTPEALETLQKSLDVWETSTYDERDVVIRVLKEHIALFWVKEDLESLVEAYGPGGVEDLPINWNLHDMVFQYYLTKPSDAIKLFVKTINDYDDSLLHGGQLANAVFANLSRLPISKNLIEAAISLVKRIPDDKRAWERLYEVWRRNDLTEDVRELFL